MTLELLARAPGRAQVDADQGGAGDGKEGRDG